MARIVTLGELLVEFVADRRNQEFSRPGPFIGPFPSGAPAIFADQAARMGVAAAHIGCVGADPFGAIIRDRLHSAGVDTTHIRTVDRPTGTAFVAYRADGGRSFVFNVQHSAAGLLDAACLSPAAFDGCAFFHVAGSSLSSDAAIDAVRKGCDMAIAAGARISFDPNVRPEMLKAFPPMRTALDTVLDRCHVFLPSTTDLQFLFPGAGEDFDQAVAALLAAHPRMEAVALKRAAAGCSYHTRHQRLDLAAHRVEEIDPTGAGDCFGGTLIAALASGAPLDEALRRANAAGALAVTRRGPMEGNSSAEALEHFLSTETAAC